LAAPGLAQCRCGCHGSNLDDIIRSRNDWRRRRRSAIMAGRGDGAGGGAAAKLDDVDLYALLGITIDATPKEIATAYRRKALKVHPDKNPDDPKAGTAGAASSRPAQSAVAH